MAGEGMLNTSDAACDPSRPAKPTGWVALPAYCGGGHRTIHFSATTAGFMMTSQLFTPIALRGLTLANRIVVAPMCQYSAVDGSGTDWHILHLGSLAVGGPSLLMREGRGVEAAGRITPGCLGLYSDANEAALKRAVEACRTYGKAAIGIQLAHAGRKASCHLSWEGGKPLAADEGAWQTVGPSAIPFDDGWHTPRALDRAGRAPVKAAFIPAARRTQRLRTAVIPLHTPHGRSTH